MASLRQHEARALLDDWRFWARDDQLAPETDWTTWLLLGGRGAGKTRAGAEWIRGQVKARQAGRIALIGETLGDVREVMIDGPSGLRAIEPSRSRPRYEASRKRLLWQNGAVAYAFSASEPDSLRGPQFDAAWSDEIGCPAIDKGTNAPNLFVDPKSAESALPPFSTGTRDDFLQRMFIDAQTRHWDPGVEEFEVEANPVSSVYGGHMVDPARVFFWTWDARPFPAFPDLTDVWADGANWQLGHWLNGRLGAAPLSELVQAILSDVDFAHAETGELSGIVDGFVIDRIMSPRDALASLMLARFFEACESEGAIRFRHLGAAPLLTLASDDLAVADDSAEAGFRLTRGQESEVPRVVRFTYIDGGADYRQAAIESRRLEVRSERVSSTGLPIVSHQADMQRVADIWLQKTWVERETAKLSLPPSRLALDPGDVITLALADRSSDYRLTRVSDAGARQAEAVASEASLYGVTIAPPRKVTPKQAASFGPVLAVFLDLPLITGAETPFAPRVAMAADPWPGRVALYRETGDGLMLDRMIDAMATIGRTLTPLAKGPTSRWDEANRLNVRLVSGMLASASAAAVLKGSNVAALETGPGAWEIIQFRDAVLQEDGSHELRGLLRGQAGSEGEMAEMLASDARFVLLNGAISEIGMSEAERGLARDWRWGPASLAHDDTAYQAATLSFEGVGLRPLSPVHPAAQREAGGDITLSWIRRTRVNGDSWAGTDVPLGEESEAYEVEIRDGANIKRLLASTVPSLTYGAAAQVTDFGSSSFTSLDITIYQISRSYGRGTGRSATLNV